MAHGLAYVSSLTKSFSTSQFSWNQEQPAVLPKMGKDVHEQCRQSETGRSHTQEMKGQRAHSADPCLGISC